MVIEDFMVLTNERTIKQASTKNRIERIVLPYYILSLI